MAPEFCHVVPHTLERESIHCHPPVSVTMKPGFSFGCAQGQDPKLQNTSGRCGGWGDSGCSSCLGFQLTPVPVHHRANPFPRASRYPQFPYRSQGDLWGRVGTNPPGKDLLYGCPPHQENPAFPGAAPRVKSPHPHQTPHMHLLKNCQIVTFSRQRTDELDGGMHVGGRRGMT